MEGSEFMPSKEKHNQQYLRNKQMSSIPQLLIDDNYDWKITMLFYAGMHCLEASFADNDVHTFTHESRKNYLYSNKSKYSDIVDVYENLEMLSRNARYKCIKMKQKKYIDAVNNVEEIEAFIKKIS